MLPFAQQKMLAIRVWSTLTPLDQSWAQETSRRIRRQPCAGSALAGVEASLETLAAWSVATENLKR